MLSKPLMILSRFARRLTVRVLLMAVFALASAVLAPWLDPLIPPDIKARFGAEAVLPVLNILASTMLTVTTFSLGVMVQAFRAASATATPRAFRILVADPITQNVLATFTGAFLFALTAIVMFRAGYYDDAAAVVVFGFTVLTIAAIVVAILRWIGHLSRLGSMDHTLLMAEQAARGPLAGVMARPHLGCLPLPADAATEGAEVLADEAGYIQFIDVEGLQACMAQDDARVAVLRRPGSHVVAGTPLAVVIGGTSETLPAVRRHFTLGKTRTLEQDVRFGLLVLTEIGVRALSPGVNDPGTAIDVINRQTGLLAAAGAPQDDPVEYDRVAMPGVTAAELVEAAYASLTRDGADRPEVAHALRSALEALQRSPWADLRDAARRALDRIGPG